ncbi:MAG: NUDIX domain-containing protein [Bacteroidia bacterium]|nr:NUDIX domain-containing protein [Bacteroidia bacterium]
MKISIRHLDKTLIITDKDAHYQQDKLNVFSISDNTKFVELDILINDWLNNDDDCVFLFSNKELLLSFIMVYLPSKFLIMYAAGGLIQKQNTNEFLFIFKKGKWDLPKGKIDESENAEEAAIRECVEETGISELEIKKNLGLTYHIFNQKNKWILKITQWYLMHSENHHKLHPQYEEGIEKAEWIKKQEVQNMVLSHTYLSVREILMRAGVI